MKSPLFVILFVAAAYAGQDTPSPSAAAAGGASRSLPPATHPMPPSSTALDSRLPLPLPPHMAQHQLENMRGHLAAVQEILAAIASRDFAGVEKAAARIEWSEEMEQMCSHMGMGAPGFTPLALTFHHTASTISAAARKRDQAEVIKTLSATLETCVKCHATYRQEVVDDTTWSRLTAAKP